MIIPDVASTLRSFPSEFEPTLQRQRFGHTFVATRHKRIPVLRVMV